MSFKIKMVGLLAGSAAVGVLFTQFNSGTPERKAVTVEGTKITVDCAVGTRSKSVKQFCADHGLRMN